MCFKNLPVEFDKDGRPYLKEGVADPYTPTRSAPIGAPMQLSAGKSRSSCGGTDMSSRSISIR